MEIKDSGKREEFETGSRRDTQEGKGRFDLLPWRALWQVAIHSEKGAAKYGERNIELGQPLSRLENSEARHLAEVFIGLQDEPHAVSKAWNALWDLEIACRIKEGLLPNTLNDLPVSLLDQLYELPYWAKKEEPKAIPTTCCYGQPDPSPYAHGATPVNEYYYLKEGDEIKEGDEYKCDIDGGWYKCCESTVGVIQQAGYLGRRRKL